ncbi:MAG: hypothetical protein WBY88_08575 [Desulfosarcina sp.]
MRCGYRQHLRRIRRIYQQRVAELRRAMIRYFPSGIRLNAANWFDAAAPAIRRLGQVIERMSQDS